MVRSERIAEILTVLRSEYERPELLDEHSPDRNRGPHPPRAIELVEFQKKFKIPPLLFLRQLDSKVGRKIQRDPGRRSEKAPPPTWTGIVGEGVDEPPVIMAAAETSPQNDFMLTGWRLQRLASAHGLGLSRCGTRNKQEDTSQAHMETGWRELQLAASTSVDVQYLGTDGSIDKLHASIPPAMLWHASRPCPRSQLTTFRLRTP